MIKLPLKYHKFYQYAAEVCEKIRSKTPRIKHEDEEGKFCLMQNNPSNFEAKYKDGTLVFLTVNSENMKISLANGITYDINLRENKDDLDEFLGRIVKTTLNKMNLCKQKDKEIYAL